MRVLDLASGTGEPAISLAMRVGEQGEVTALDVSAGLLEIAIEWGRRWCWRPKASKVYYLP